jgi:predicted RNA-binding protein with PIN domain
MGPKLILVDGYNVIRNMRGLAFADRASLATGRESLLAQVRARFRQTPHRVIVVFDGDGPRETRQALAGMSRGQVVFTRHGETADDVTRRLAAEAGSTAAPVVVCTNDLALRSETGALGAGGASVPELERALNAAPKHLERRVRHQQAVRRQWEDDEDEVARPRKGNPRRAPKRRRGRTEPQF